MTLGTVGSPKGLPKIADVAVKAADMEISEEVRDARVEPVPAEPSELRSATHNPFRSWWHRRTEDALEIGHDVVSLEFGFFGNSAAGQTTAPFLCKVDHVSGTVFAVLTSKAVQ